MAAVWSIAAACLSVSLVFLTPPLTRRFLQAGRHSDTKAWLCVAAAVALLVLILTLTLALCGAVRHRAKYVDGIPTPHLAALGAHWPLEALPLTLPLAFLIVVAPMMPGPFRFGAVPVQGVLRGHLRLV